MAQYAVLCRSTRCAISGGEDDDDVTSPPFKAGRRYKSRLDRSVSLPAARGMDRNSPIILDGADEGSAGGMHQQPDANHCIPTINPSMKHYLHFLVDDDRGSLTAVECSTLYFLFH